MVSVTIPNAIQSGRNAIMTCDYELENDDLYSVKWYKGKREFFRYTPKEIPSIKIFKLPGIRVDVSWLTYFIDIMLLLPLVSLFILSTRLSLSYNILYIQDEVKVKVDRRSFCWWSAKVIWFNPILVFTLNPLPRKQIHLGGFIECE